MRRRHLVLAALACSARAATPLDAVRTRLANAPLLRGAFKQQRRLNGLRHPLQSEGEFVFVRGSGLLWLTQKPVVSTLIVTAERLESRDAQGQRVSQFDVREQPSLRSINQLLLATLSADLGALAQLFEVAVELIGDTGWRLTLTARDPLLQRQLASATLAGEQTVREVRIEERAGNVTEVDFSRVRQGGSLTDSEQAWLAGR
jgi:hypothetical protein